MGVNIPLALLKILESQVHKLVIVIISVLIILVSNVVVSEEKLIIIKKESREGKKREDFYYLIGTQSRGKSANFTLWRNQFNESKKWDGKGNPKLTINDAVLKAREFYKNEAELKLVELELRLGYSIDSNLWYYLISLAKPNDFTLRGVESENIYTVVVLTSGEVLPPYIPK